MSQVYECEQKGCNRPVREEDDFLFFPSVWYAGTPVHGNLYIHHDCYVKQQTEREKKRVRQQHEKEMNRANRWNWIRSLLKTWRLA